MTAHALAGDRERLLAAGMDDYISKPVRVGELVAALERSQPLSREARAETDETREPSPDTEPILSLEVLEEFRTAMGDEGAAMLAELVELFFEDAPQLLETLRSSLAAGDVEKAQRAVHTLKGTSASLGATHLSQLCAELEAALRAGSSGELQEMLAQVEAAYAQAKPALRALVAESGAMGTKEEMR